MKPVDICDLSPRYQRQVIEKLSREKLPPKTEKENKYHAETVQIAGIKYDSRKEARTLPILLDRLSQGEIKDLRRQVIYILQESYINLDGVRIKAMAMRVDYDYIEVSSGGRVACEVKSPATKTRVYENKKKLFGRRYPEIRFEEV